MTATLQTPLCSGNLPLLDSAADWRIVDGRIRSRRRKSGRVTYFIDFYPKLKGRDQRLYSHSGITLETREDAERIQQRIKALTDKGHTLAEAVGAYRQPKDRRNRVEELVGRWMKWLTEDGELEPYTLLGYRGHVNNQFKWWGNRTVDMIDWDLLFEWTVWMREEKGLAPKTIKNVLTTMKSFLNWQRMRDKSFVIPQFPTVKRGKRKKPVTMPLLDQAAVLSQIADDDRGIFLAYAHLTLRQGEGRACLVEHYDFKRRELWVGDAMKGNGPNATRGDTKTGESGRYPVSEDLAAWIERHVPSEARFRGDVPLFPNPRTGKIYSRETIQNLWRRACRVAGVDFIPPYRATKHSTLSELARVLTPQQLQGLARHKKFETTRGYFGEDADPKAEAQAARAKLLESKGKDGVRRIREEDDG
ncbi:MAG: site-specific integrase [Myxococcales bacterium]|nr:site-specific integrase [Myxococcales bacterium]